MVRFNTGDLRCAAGVVKMRRGQTARVWREVNTHGDAYAAFQQWVDVLAKKARGAGFMFKIRLFVGVAWRPCRSITSTALGWDHGHVLSPISGSVFC